MVRSPAGVHAGPCAIRHVRLTVSTMSSVAIPAPRERTAPAPRRHRATRAAFYIHLWLGVLVTVGLISISITGILLNHKRGLGLMPEVEHAPTGGFSESISLERMALAALEA